MIEVGGITWKSWREVCKALGLSGGYAIPADPEEWVMRRLGITDRAQLAPVMSELKARASGVRVTVSEDAAATLRAMLDTASLADVQLASGLGIERLTAALAELRRLADGV